MSGTSPQLLPYTLYLLILRTLSAGPLHGYAIARRIKQCSADVLDVEEGSLYPALNRMLLKRWLRAEWGLRRRTGSAFLPAHRPGPETAGLRSYRVQQTGHRYPTGDEDRVRRLCMQFLMQLWLRLRWRFLVPGLSTVDWTALLAVIGVLGAVALLATSIPVMRALRVDPMVALRYE
jgi:ABC-type antimicrobial peptide transport system permease subunit